MQVELLILRLIHVLGGIFWVGSGLFTAFLLIPALAPNPGLVGQVTAALARRRVFIIVPTTAILTILSGVRLMGITSNNFSRDYFVMAMGKTYAISAIAAILSLLIGVVVGRPAGMRLAKLSQMAASGEQDREKLAAETRMLQRRTAASQLVATILLILAAAGMAVARYM